MKKLPIVLVVIMMLFLIGCMQDKTIPEDVKIEATLILNKNEQLIYKDYVLEIVIEKENGLGMIYPYMDGLHHTMTFDSNEEEGYYVPNNIGVNGNDEVIVVKELREHNIIDGPSYSSFIGFNTPKEAGKYKARMYFQEGYEFDEYDFDGYDFDNLYLIYLHKENKNEWAKLVKIKTKIEN